MVSKKKPDIYHFVFDSYTNSQTLKKYWNYVNPVDSFLTKKGFNVVAGSFSNYDFTPFSLGSVFNLQYLTGTGKYLHRDGKNFYIGRKAFLDNELFKILKANNYKLNNFSFLDSIEYLQRMGTLGPQKPVSWLRNQTLERLYLNPWIKHKILHKFYHPAIPPDIVRNYEAYIDYHQRAVHYFTTYQANSRNNNTPNFYLVHFFIPHDPYVFNTAGKVDFRNSRPEQMNGYLNQIKYANMVIEEIVSLLLQDPREKVIIIQGDHGYRDTEKQMTEMDQFACLNAVYFYDYNYKDLYNGISLVNTYRLVLNNYFDYDMPLLKDSIFLRKGSYPINFKPLQPKSLDNIQ